MTANQISAPEALLSAVAIDGAIVEIGFGRPGKRITFVVSEVSPDLEPIEYGWTSLYVWPSLTLSEILPHVIQLLPRTADLAPHEEPPTFTVTSRDTIIGVDTGTFEAPRIRYQSLN